jgi:hypothetical protein
VRCLGLEGKSIPDRQSDQLAFHQDFHFPGQDDSWLVGLVVSGAVYRVLSRSLDLTREQAAIEASDRELQELERR